jgi:ABC-type nitrate/sulfonate/bicarbonate transport system substrate-binding protein
MNPKLLLIAALLAVAASSARADETIGINSFPGASNLPVLAGQREGMFHRAGIEIVLSHPKGSVDQFKGLAAGNYQVLLTALDNVVAYGDGHGEADLGGPLDLVAVMGMDTGFLTLVAAPGTRGIAALKGKTMAVDALTTGFSFALQDLLARAGVAKDAVTYVAVGSSGARWKALEDGKAQGALLALPLDLEAKDKGYAALASVAGTLGHYQATVGAVRRNWAASHRAAMVAFLKAYRQAVAWVVAPANKDAALAILHDEMPSLDRPALARVLAILVDPRSGISRSLAIDPKGAAEVLSLRAKYAAPASKPSHDWRFYVDTSYLSAARR